MVRTSYVFMIYKYYISLLEHVLLLSIIVCNQSALRFFLLLQCSKLTIIYYLILGCIFTRKVWWLNITFWCLCAKQLACNVLGLLVIQMCVAKLMAVCRILSLFQNHPTLPSPPSEVKWSTSQLWRFWWQVCPCSVLVKTQPQSFIRIRLFLF